ncbi:hypothetical protein [Paenibacillus odorifer]|uniref:hypothetical protein n=1 Tax=Paenibacillus odorifer TaxID=189426 RepID=UPI002116F6AD|nr:hypothetical protein [Paenibacillus odorifer]
MDSAVWPAVEILEPASVRESLKQQLSQWTKEVASKSMNSVYIYSLIADTLAEYSRK